MIAKMILPLLGGSPGVWNTCMFFFQAMLLAGYAYVHVITTRLEIRRQVPIHLALLFLPLFVLPIGVAAHWRFLDSDHPIPWLLGLLTVSVGLPFFVLSTTAPLLQKWFASTDHPSAVDPYFLYAASNVGSMLALLGYPVVIEPYLPLKSGRWLSQNWIWTVGYALLILLVMICGWIVRQSATGLTASKEQGTRRDVGAGQTAIMSPPPSSLTYLGWIALAFVPSSLMLGATAYVTLNIAAIPLLWVLPLALYLLSFILVFAKWPPAAHRTMVIAMPLVLFLLVFTLMPSALTVRFWIVILLHLVTLFVVALVCHGELARSRPSTEHLTVFYLLMSVGGALGGIFNALLAPVIFNSVVEYQLTLVLAGLLLPRLEVTDSRMFGRWLASPFLTRGGVLHDVAWASALGLLTMALLWISHSEGLSQTLTQNMDWVSRLTAIKPTHLVAMVACGLPLLLCCGCVARPLRFGLSLGAILLASGLSTALQDDLILHRERTFFGVLTVKLIQDEHAHKLVHGTVNHGMQSLDPSRRDEPLTYYHRAGPIGQIFGAFRGPQAKTQVAMIGLGTGTLASYLQPGQSLTFYEIDPAVVRIAQNPQYFTYYEQCRQRGVDIQVVLGDARLRLEEATERRYDLIIVDAFNSDAIPVHLMTREAIALYFRTLTTDGLLAVHISNSYLKLEPVLGNVANALHLVGLQQDDQADEKVPGKFSSHWVILANRWEALGTLAEDARWTPLKNDLWVGVWTDDFSNVLRVFDWTTRH